MCMLENTIAIVDKEIGEKSLVYSVVLDDEKFGISIQLKEQERVEEQVVRALFASFSQAVECAVELAFRSVMPNRLLEQLLPLCDAATPAVKTEQLV